METIYILNNYRTSILEDAKGLQILSLLYLKGESSDETISNELDLPLNELNSFLAKYFSSKLIKKNSKKEWYLSDFSKHTLFKTKIAEAINDSVIENFKISEKDKKMFKIFINFDFDHNPYYLNTCHLYHHQSLNDFYVKNDITKEYFLQSLYSVIFGLNPFLKNHKSEDFLNFVLKHNSSETSFLTKYKDYFIKRLDESKINISENNNYINFSDNIWDEKLHHMPLISSSRFYCINRNLLDDDLEFYLKSNDQSKNNLVKIIFKSKEIGDYFNENFKLTELISKENKNTVFDTDSVLEYTAKMIVKSYHNNIVDKEIQDSFQKVINITPDLKPKKTIKSKPNYLNKMLKILKRLFCFLRTI